MTTKTSTVSNKEASSNYNKRVKADLPFNLPGYSKGFKAFIAFLLVLVLFIVTHVVKFPGSVGYLMEVTDGQKTFDLLPSFSSAETYERLESFTQAGRSMYMRTMLTVDFVFPLSMFLFLYLFSKYALQNSRLKPALMIAFRSLPVAYLLLDFLENLTIFQLLKYYPDRLHFLASNIGYLTVGKRTFMMAAILLPLIITIINKIPDRFLTKQYRSVKVH